MAVQSKVVKTEERMNFKVVKFSEGAENLKMQIPGQINTGSNLGGRFTTSKLNG